MQIKNGFELLISFVILLALDFAYLSFNKDAYLLQIASVQRVSLQPRYLGAILCYAFILFGLWYFILRTHRPVIEAILLGLVIYGVYETTNYATLKKWEPQLAIMDVLWGGALFGLTTYLTYQITKK
jgi:uncharacterized membrane protein